MEGRRTHRSRRRRRRSAGPLAVILVLAAFLAVGIGSTRLYLANHCVRPELTIEAGERCPAVTEFLNWDYDGARFVSEINETTVLTQPGDYPVTIRAYGKKSDALLRVRDTVTPVVYTQDMVVYSGNPIEPEMFLKEVQDVTETTARFQTVPDGTVAGVTTVILEVVDAGGNVTAVPAKLEVIRDTVAPQITGVKELTISAGDSVSYKKGVTVTDDHDPAPQLTVDASAANTNVIGDYTIVYTAADAQGNETTVSTTLHVKRPAIESVTEEIVNAEADQLLSKILDDSMTEYEKAEAIYWWCHDKIAYSDGAPKVNWMQGAYQGIVMRKGDCYTYASTAKCLLTRAGIKNQDIERIRVGDSMHFWNIIDIGEGWRHFDTTRRVGGATFFYKTDAELMEYSNSHNGTHNYDRTIYTMFDEQE